MASTTTTTITTFKLPTAAGSSPPSGKRHFVMPKWAVVLVVVGLLFAVGVGLGLALGFHRSENLTPNSCTKPADCEATEFCYIPSGEKTGTCTANPACASSAGCLPNQFCGASSVCEAINSTCTSEGDGCPDWAYCGSTGNCLLRPVCSSNADCLLSEVCATAANGDEPPLNVCKTVSCDTGTCPDSSYVCTQLTGDGFDAGRNVCVRVQDCSDSTDCPKDSTCVANDPADPDRKVCAANQSCNPMGEDTCPAHQTCDPTSHRCFQLTQCSTDADCNASLSKCSVEIEGKTYCEPFVKCEGGTPLPDNGDEDATYSSDCKSGQVCMSDGYCHYTDTCSNSAGATNVCPQGWRCVTDNEVNTCLENTACVPGRVNVENCPAGEFCVTSAGSSSSAYAQYACDTATCKGEVCMVKGTALSTAFCPKNHDGLPCEEQGCRSAADCPKTSGHTAPACKATYCTGGCAETGVVSASSSHFICYNDEFESIISENGQCSSPQDCAGLAAATGFAMTCSGDSQTPGECVALCGGAGGSLTCPTGFTCSGSATTVGICIRELFQCTTDAECTSTQADGSGLAGYKCCTGSTCGNKQNTCVPNNTCDTAADCVTNLGNYGLGCSANKVCVACSALPTSTLPLIDTARQGGAGYCNQLSDTSKWIQLVQDTVSGEPNSFFPDGFKRAGGGLTGTALTLAQPPATVGYNGTGKSVAVGINALYPNEPKVPKSIDISTTLTHSPYSSFATLSSGGNIGINVPTATVGFTTPAPVNPSELGAEAEAALVSGATAKNSVIGSVESQITTNGPLAGSLGDYYLTTDGSTTSIGALGINVDAYKKSDSGPSVAPVPVVLYVEKGIVPPAVPRVAVVLMRNNTPATIGWLRRDTASFVQPMSSMAANRFPWYTGYQASESTVNIRSANDSLLGFVMGFAVHGTSSGYDGKTASTADNVVPVCTAADGNWQIGERGDPASTTTCKASGVPLSYGFQLGNITAEVENGAGDIISYSNVDGVNTATANKMYWGTFGSSVFLGTPAPAFWSDSSNANRNPSLTTTPAPTTTYTSETSQTYNQLPQWLMYGFPQTLNNTAEFTYTPMPASS